MGHISNTSLHLAAIFEKKEACLVKHYIKSGIDINIKNSQGNTPLHLAIQNGGVEVMKYLVENGADINAINFHSVSPLQLALSNGTFNTIKYLVENGAEVNPK